ncbi:MAG: GNAT family N-acetyltransferase, partial [Alphaproteobacteria bacterium]|nr:GNAT family N-acetyltransferase [Alphaproteobacteria bacterium]
RRAGFAGELVLANPDDGISEGLTVYPSAADLPHGPDLAVITAPFERVPALIAELAARGTRAAVITAAEVRKAGEPDRSLQQDALDAAKPQLMRIVGPDSLGIMTPRLGLDATYSHLAGRAGDIAFASQSGAMVTAMLDWAAPREVGFSHVLSLGDMADVDFGDVLDYFAADPHTRAILLYVESITQPRKFMSAARAASRVKPVLVLKAGRSTATGQAAAANAGAVLGADGAYDAAFRRAGMLRVATMAELFDAAETLALTREQIGERLAILTNSGAAGMLATDALAAAGGRLAELSSDTVARLNRAVAAPSSRSNPIDIAGDAPGARCAEALAALIRDPAADAILVLNSPNALVQPEETANAVIEAVGAAEADALRARNVLTAWLGEHSARAARQRFAKARIATYETPDDAVAGFMHRVQHRRNQELLMQTPPARSDAFTPDLTTVRQVIATALADGKSWLGPEGCGAILAAYGIPVVNDVLPTLRCRDVMHLLAGLVDDPLFGPLVVFGRGGTASQSPSDTSMELPLLNELLAHRLIARTSVAELPEGFTGTATANMGPIAQLLIRLGQLAADHPEIRELDINPLLADAAGVVALGARMRVAPAAGMGTTRLVIAPYPKNLESTERLRDGTVFRMRPLRPEDEPLLHDLAAHMSEEDLRLRFFMPMRRLSHALAARLSQLDYDREMALLAEIGGKALGVARFAADPDKLRAEYAIAVRSDWKGRGLGYLLMTRLIDVARQRGIGELVGEVLRENEPMLQMCRELGFSIALDPNDPGLMLVGKSLAESSRHGGAV